MRIGDAVTQKATCLVDKIIPVAGTDVFLAPDEIDCCYILPVFGDLASDEDLKNDFTSFLRPFEVSTTSVLMFLTRNNGADIPLTDDTLGTFFALGFHVDVLGRNYIGFILDWKKILTAHGPDEYQLIYTTETILGTGAPGEDFAYCLLQYTAERADGTLRYKFSNSFILKDRFNVRKRIYFPANWTNQIRVFGILVGLGSDYEKTFTKYKDETLRTVQDKEIPKYRIRIDLAPMIVHNMIRTEVNQADLIEITDYNRNNSERFEDRALRNPSEYKPTDTEINQLRSVTFEYEDRYDIGLKKHC